ncbi:TPA: hypothetical protein U5E27_000736 [Yersinia enterocolitica]|nr:hypothetical protein [Yersinia enterocolitica]
MKPDNDICKCECGFTWKRGFGGHHYCEPQYRATIASLEAERDAALNTCTLIAEALGITGAVAGDTIARVQQLVAESASLGSGRTYFSYGVDSGYEEHSTAEKAQEAAEADIDYYRGDACDGWSDEVDQVVWGVVIERLTQTGLRKRTDDDSCDSSIDKICDYVLLPEVETLATTQAFNEMKAQGVDELSEWSLKANNGFGIDVTPEEIALFAASLRGNN